MICRQRRMLKLSHIVSLLVCCLAALDDGPPDVFSESLIGKTDLMLGEDLVLSCNIDESFDPLTASNASFLLQVKDNTDHLTCIPESSVRVVNQSLAVLTLKNVTFNNIGPYGCYVGNKTCPDGPIGYDRQTVAISEDVMVEYFPQNVTNFSCVVDNWGPMICTWQHPVVYQQLSSIDVTLNYASCNIRPVTAYRCPVLSYTSCRWTPADLNSNSCFHMEVVVNNTKHGVATTKIFNVIPTNLVKPAPVSELSILTEMPGCFVLSWQHQSKNVVFRVRQQKAKNNEFTIVEGNTTLSNLTLCGYPPFTWYNFSVDCYPSYPYSGYWSDPACKDATSSMIAPELGPRMTNGSFTSTECVGGMRNVTLMWQEVEKSAQNGIIDGYLIMMDERVVKNVTSGTYYSASVELLPCDETSVVRVVAYNKGGSSVSPTVVLIPPTRVTAPVKVQESFAVADMSKQSGGGGGYIYPVQVLWEKQDEGQDGGSDITIFWCERKDQDKLCQGQISWLHAADNQTSYDIPDMSSTPTSYLFGISVVQEGLACGIFWTDCLFRNNPFSLQQKLSQQTLAVKSLENEVLVSWSEIKCSYETQTRVTSYRVKWSEVTEANTSNQIHHYDVPGTENMYTVSDLTASVKYRFTVQPIADKDLGDEVMPWKVAEPRTSDNKLWMIPVIIVVAVATVVLLLAGFYFYRKCKRSRKKVLYIKESAQTVPFDKAAPRVVNDAPTLLRSNSSPTASARLLPGPPDVNSSSQLSPDDLRIWDLPGVPRVPDVQESALSDAESGQINGRADLSNHVSSSSCQSGPANQLAGRAVFRLQDDNSQAEEMEMEEYLLMARGEGDSRGLETSPPQVITVIAGAPSVLGQVGVPIVLEHKGAALVVGHVSAIQPLEFSEESEPAVEHGSSGNSRTPVNSNGYVRTSPAGAEASSNQESLNSLEMSGTFSSQDIPYSVQIDGDSSGRSSPCGPQMCGPFLIGFNSTTLQSSGQLSDQHDPTVLQPTGQSSDQHNPMALQTSCQPLNQHTPTDLQSSSDSGHSNSDSTSAGHSNSDSTSARQTSSGSASAEDYIRFRIIDNQGTTLDNSSSSNQSSL